MPIKRKIRMEIEVSAEDGYLLVSKGDKHITIPLELVGDLLTKIEIVQAIYLKCNPRLH
jgi:hypothetical protein